MGWKSVRWGRKSLQHQVFVSDNRYRPQDNFKRKNGSRVCTHSGQDNVEFFELAISLAECCAFEDYAVKVVSTVIPG